jgi:hypothetical protein
MQQSSIDSSSRRVPAFCGASKMIKTDAVLLNTSMHASAKLAACSASLSSCKQQDSLSSTLATAVRPPPSQMYALVQSALPAIRTNNWWMCFLRTGNAALLSRSA